MTNINSYKNYLSISNNTCENNKPLSLLSGFRVYCQSEKYDTQNK